MAGGPSEGPGASRRGWNAARPWDVHMGFHPNHRPAVNAGDYRRGLGEDPNNNQNVTPYDTAE
jgi:hypothetical protein